MKRYKARITVMLHRGLLDPQGKTVEQSLKRIGFKNVENVRVGKVVDLVLRARSREEALQMLNEMCKKLLSNPVTEKFNVELKQA